MSGRIPTGYRVSRTWCEPESLAVAPPMARTEAVGSARHRKSGGDWSTLVYSPGAISERRVRIGREQAVRRSHISTVDTPSGRLRGWRESNEARNCGARTRHPPGRGFRPYCVRSVHRGHQDSDQSFLVRGRGPMGQTGHHSDTGGRIHVLQRRQLQLHLLS